MGIQLSLCCSGSSHAKDVADDVNPTAAPNASLNYFDAVMSESEFQNLTERDKESFAESIFFETRQRSSTTTGPEDYTPANQPNQHPAKSISMDAPDSLLMTSVTKSQALLRKQLKSPAYSVGLKGYPGELTNEEVERCLEFRRMLKENDKEKHHDMVHCYKDVEEEPYALCRHLRARKFDPQACLKMLDECVEDFGDAQAHDFYRDINAALGCPLSVLLTQLPACFFSGVDKNGCLIFYLLAGKLSFEGMDCLTNLEEKIIRYVWYAMKHALEKAAAKAGGDVRCEMLAVVDLKGLSQSILSKRTLSLLKGVLPAISAFPEVLNRVIIFNAPHFFSYSWMVIQQFIDDRTQTKVEIHSSDAKTRLLELVDPAELLREVGGKGNTLDEVIQEETDRGIARQISKLLKLSPGEDSIVEFALSSNEQADVIIYTNSEADVQMEALEDHDKVWREHVVSPDGGPYHATIVKEAKGPGKFAISVECKAKTTGHFVVVMHVSENDDTAHLN